MNLITDKRNRKIKDLMHKVSKFIVNYCDKQGIGTIVVGYNQDWKTSSRLGNKNNQTFVSIPYEKLLSMIKYKSELLGLKVELVKEAYTSKCDSLALEPIEKHQEYLGKRVKRGLFQSSAGKLLNADINGSLNILRKVIDNSSYIKKIINSGLLFRPVRINNLFLINSFNCS